MDLNDIKGGPDNSPDTVFFAVTIGRALYLPMYGMKGSVRLDGVAAAGATSAGSSALPW